MLANAGMGERARQALLAPRVGTVCPGGAPNADISGVHVSALEVRLGRKKAAVAVAHKLLVIVYHLLSEGTVYDEQRYAHLQSKQEERRRVPSRRLRAWAIMSP